MSDKYDMQDADQLYEQLYSAQRRYAEVQGSDEGSEALIYAQQEVIERLEAGLVYAFMKAYTMAWWNDASVSGHSDYLAGNIIQAMGVERLKAGMMECLPYYVDRSQPLVALNALYKSLNYGNTTDRGADLASKMVIQESIAETFQAMGWKLAADGNSFIPAQ